MESKRNLKRTRQKNNTGSVINSKLKKRTNQYLPSFLVLKKSNCLLTVVVSLWLLCVVHVSCEGLDLDIDSVNRHHHLYQQSEAFLVNSADSDSSPGHFPVIDR